MDSSPSSRSEPSGGFGSRRPNPNDNPNSTRLPGLAGTESEKQLTQRELAALKTIKRNVDTTKYGGWMIGAAGTYVLLSRRKPPPRMLSKLGWSVVGGLGGSFLAMPIGILLSKDVLKDVEDPQHLRRVLAGAIEEQRQGKRPQLGVAPPKGLNGETDFEQQQQQQQPEWGGERAAQSYGGGGFDSNGNATGAPSDSFTSFSSAPQSSSSATSGGRNASSDSASDAGGPPDGTGAGTRWAQLRGERGVEPSKWERIRQDNARTAYSRSASSRVEQPIPQDPSASSEVQSAPPRQPGSGNSTLSTPRSAPRSRDEPVMTLSGAEDDPRWSSPASFSPQSSGWGNNEFLDDPAAGGSNDRRNAAGARRGYGILSVLEDGPATSHGGVQIESDAPIQVIKGSLLTALVGGVGGSIYGVLRGRQGAGTVLGTRMAFSSFAFAFPFFAVREYVMSPVLNRTSSGPDPANRHMRLRTTPRNRHTNNLLASGLAGAIVGAGAAGFARGPAAIHKGIVTFGVACTGLQLAGNEVRILRDAVIRPKPKAIPVPEALSPQPNSSDAAVSASQGAAPLIDIQSTPASDQREDAQISKQRGGSSWLSKVKNAMPIRSVSDEEYETKLKERLTGVNQRMADVEQEIREIEELIKRQQQQQPHGEEASSSEAK